MATKTSYNKIASIKTGVVGFMKGSVLVDLVQAVKTTTDTEGLVTSTETTYTIVIATTYLDKQGKEQYAKHQARIPATESNLKALIDGLEGLKGKIPPPAPKLLEKDAKAENKSAKAKGRKVSDATAEELAQLLNPEVLFELALITSKRLSDDQFDALLMSAAE